MDLYESLRFGLLFQMVFCISPFRLINGDFRKSKILTIISIPILIYCTYAFIFKFMFGWFTEVVLKNHPGIVAYAFAYIAIFLTIQCYVVTIVSLNYHQQQQIDLLKLLYKVDKDLKRLFKTRFNYKRFQIFIIIRILFIFCFFFMLQSFMITLYFNEIGWFNILEHFVCYTLTACVNGLMSFSYFAYIKLISSKLNVITNQLEKFTTKNAAPQGNEPLFEILRIHKELCRAIDLLSKIYGYPILTSILHDYILVSTNLFHVIWLGNKVGFHSEEVLILGIFNAIWMIPNLLKSAVASHLCHQTINKLKKFDHLFMWINNCERNPDTERTALSEHFLLSRFHYNYRFTVKEYFSIDATLLFSVCSVFEFGSRLVVQFVFISNLMFSGDFGNMYLPSDSSRISTGGR